MRQASESQKGCFGSCGMFGCALLMAALVLPVGTCFGGSKIKGYEMPPILIGLLASGAVFALLPIYATAAACAAVLVLINGRVSRGWLVAILPSPIAALLSASTPLQTGYVVWALAVTALAFGVLCLFTSEDSIRLE